MKKIKASEFDIASHVTECGISYRGGTIKVDVSEIFPKVEDAIMGAYQNYLGGGIAGRIISAAMFNADELPKAQKEAYDILSERIRKYFYEVNQGGGDEYMVENVNSYEHNQGMPVSAY